MVEDQDVSAQQIKQVTKQALRIERYLLRRAWGLCYVVLAAEIALITLLPLVFSSVGLSADYGFTVRLAVNTAISITGLVVISWIFRKVYNAMKVRREITDSIWGKRGRPRWATAIWLLYYLPILVAIIFFRPIGSLVLYILLAVASPSFYYAFKVSFPDRIPREGIAVFVTYTVCAVTNLILFLLNAQYTVYPLIWAAMVIVCAVASVVAYIQKPPHPPEEPS